MYIEGFCIWNVCFDINCLAMMWGSHSMTHSDILPGISNLKPLDVQLKYRFICFLKKCLDHDNAAVKNVASIALNNPMSCVGNNYRQVWEF